MRLEKNLDPNPIQEKLKTAVTTFKEAMPIVKALRNEYLGETHWAQIKGLIKKDFDINQPDFTLDSLIALDVNQFQEEITSISTQATQEFRLRQQLQEIDDVYKKTNFEITFNEKVECNILGSPEELYVILDETLANINMILGSRFVKPLRKEAEEWKGHINKLCEMVDVWYAVQRSWMYLENIFKAADIKKAMPVETKNFEGVDKNFKILMARTSKDPKCINIVKKAAKTLDDLNHFNDVLDDVQKKLEDYMEMKRRAFPRFYFLSNDELIDILANS
jgi:dynein heavy chain